MRLTKIGSVVILLSLSGCKDNTPVGNGHLSVEGGFGGSFGYQGGQVEFVFVSTFPLDAKKSGQFMMGPLGETGKTTWTLGYECPNGSSTLYSVGNGSAEVAGHKFSLTEGELFILKRDFTVVQINAQFEELDRDALSEKVNKIYETWISEQDGESDS